MGDEWPEGEEYEEEAPLPPPRRSSQAQRPARRPPPAARSAPRGTTTAASRRAAARGRAPRRDTFPIAVSVVVVVLLLGLMVVFLGLNGNNSGTPSTNAQAGTNPTAAAPAGVVTVVANAPTASASDPPRMPLADFKALYDDPAKRPLILDVRAVDAFDQGHIPGAISFPEADVDARINELPKNRLIVAYCQ